MLTELSVVDVIGCRVVVHAITEVMVVLSIYVHNASHLSILLQELSLILGWVINGVVA